VLALLALVVVVSGLLVAVAAVELGMVLDINLQVPVVLGMDPLLYLVDHMQVVVKDNRDLQ
tara:strand:+ start:286 stop:468 length:183 start_codon:yes stop_codon:yes gene_type:complete